MARATGILRGRTHVDGERLRIALRQVGAATGVKLSYDDTLERLDEAEQLELLEIHGRLSTPLGSGGPALVPLCSPEDRVLPREIAKDLRARSDEPRPWVRRGLAAFVERVGRPPTDAEVRVYFGAGKADTHESLRRSSRQRGRRRTPAASCWPTAARARS